ncbi:M3 family metallopeptidase [Candidatus Uabimicrobium amorphum]|uniref:Uncharacterized protein n=1 Tax=Uabimicrobium amorphum TaxID=2596890 RepID=A0A5S9IN33_UABAM|nr:M3 family metallopeptidase [Candidatus Uabimicrobium amorphum]BBM84090.1 hypothetical protein UABAM_02446 [Candidatus Uabimicrobium amorphum]
MSKYNQEQIQKTVDEICHQQHTLAQKSMKTFWDMYCLGQPGDLASLEKESAKIAFEEQYFDVIQTEYHNPQINDALFRKKIERLHTMFCYERVKRHPEIIEIGEKLQKIYGSFTPNYKGKDLSSLEIREILHFDSDRQKREDVYRNRLEITDVCNEELSNYYKILAEVAAEKDVDFLNLALKTSSISQDELEREMSHFIRDIDNYRQECITWLQEYAEENKLFSGEIAPWDTKYLEFHMENKFKKMLPLDKPLEIMHDIWKKMGIDTQNLDVEIDVEKRPHKSPSFAFCVAPDIPNDVRICVLPDDTIRSQKTLLHEYGHALFYKLTDQKDKFFQDPNIVVTEASAIFSEQTVHDVDWASEYIKDKSLLSEYEKFGKYSFISWIYRMPQTYFFEKQCLEQKGQNIQEIRKHINREYSFLKADFPFTGHDAEYILFYNQPFYVSSYFLAGMLVNTVSSKLKKEHSSIMTPHTGKMWREIWQHGGLYSADEVLKKFLHTDRLQPYV